MAVKLNVPSGYVLKGVFSDEARQCSLQKEGGEYYLIVPKGGGVFVNMWLEAKSDSSKNDGSAKEPAGKESGGKNKDKDHETTYEGSEGNPVIAPNEAGAYTIPALTSTGDCILWFPAGSEYSISAAMLIALLSQGMRRFEIAIGGIRYDISDFDLKHILKSVQPGENLRIARDPDPRYYYELNIYAGSGTQRVGKLPMIEETHNTAMAAEISIAALSAGNDFVSAATEGLALASNVGAEGVSSFAQPGVAEQQQTQQAAEQQTQQAVETLQQAAEQQQALQAEYMAAQKAGTVNYYTVTKEPVNMTAKRLYLKR